MKRILARIFVILSLWWLAGGLFLVSLANTYYIGLFELLLVLGFILLPAILASVLVWTDYEIFPFQTRPEQNTERLYQSKNKNTSPEDQRLNTLLALMDDDERDAFKQALKDQYLGTSTKRKNHLTDGELPFDAEDYAYDDDNFSRR
jgi:hypothetical protein